MAACSCGKKKPFGASECTDCFQERRAKEEQQVAEDIKRQHPKLYALAVEQEIPFRFFPQIILDELPEDMEVLAYAGLVQNVFLTSNSILKLETTVLSPRVKQRETIPLATVTGFEAKPPRASEKYPLWTFRITRAANIDEFQVTDGKNVRHFVEKINELLSKVGQPAAAQPSGGSAEAIADKIRALAGLRDSGLLSDEEFEAKKTELLKEI